MIFSLVMTPRDDHVNHDYDPLHDDHHDSLNVHQVPIFRL